MGYGSTSGGHRASLNKPYNSGVHLSLSSTGRPSTSCVELSMTPLPLPGRSPLAALLLLLASPALLPAQIPTSKLDDALIAGLRWRNVGPANMGGRISDIAGIPSPSRTFFVASAGGGIWKTVNAGTTFRLVFGGNGNEGVASMGMLAIAPSDT